MNIYNRTFVEIDLKQIKKNYIELKALVGDDVVIAPVIKADAYGYGSEAVAGALSEVGADFFIVATVREAIELRKSDVSARILVLGYVDESEYEFFYDYDLDISLLYKEQASLIRTMDDKYKKRLRVHVNIDTGMRRLGLVACEDTKKFLKEVISEDFIEIAGIYSHFATADEQDKSGALIQLKSFEEVLSELDTEDLLVHIANSAAILDIENSHKKLVRAGIVVYGLYPSEDVSRAKADLEPALSWYSHIIGIRDLEAGECVSYGASFKADKKMKVATVGIGYADGYSRLLSARGQVLVGGKRANILGRVCMDLTVVDVTGMDVNLGDEVVLIGKQGDEEITVHEIAKLMGTIDYEVTCGISKRVLRKYVS